MHLLDIKVHMGSSMFAYVLKYALHFQLSKEIAFVSGFLAKMSQTVIHI